MVRTARRPAVTPEHFTSYLGGRIDALRSRGNITGILEEAAVEGDYLKVLISGTRFSSGLGRPFGPPDNGLMEFCFDVSFATVANGDSAGGLHITLVEDGLHATLSCKLPEPDSCDTRHLQLVQAS